MKANNPSNDDKVLRAALKEWQVDASLPPGFRQQVWRRIESEETQPVGGLLTWTKLRDWIAVLIPRPAVALACVGVLLAAGASFGWSQARHETSRVSQEMSRRYVQLVDPFQLPR